MNKTLIALPAGKATGLSAYRQGAAQAVEQRQPVGVLAVGHVDELPHWLADALDDLPPDSRRGFLVVVACYAAAAGAVADDFAVRRKVSALINRKITEGGFA